MPRPRVHDLDQVLDAVETLAARSGPAAVTIRAVGSAAGVSNGVLYHAFGSHAGLVGSAWLRAGRRFLELQSALVDQELAGTAACAVDAVAAAADAPVEFAARYPDSSKLLLEIRRDQLLGEELPGELAAQLHDLDRQLVGLMIRLSVALWNRKDADAVDTITACIVDLPTAIVLSRDRLGSPIARQHLRAAVRAVLAVGPAQQPKGSNR